MANNMHTQSSLNDLISVRANRATVFHKYISQKEVGLKIFKEMNERIIDLGEGKMGIPMDDVTQKVGLLSQCQGLQTLVSLAKDFKLGFDEMFDGVENQKGTIREIMDAMLEDIVSTIKHKNAEGKDRYIFDASPYDSAHFTEKCSSIETITWVLPSLFQILKYHAEIGEVCKWEKDLVGIIRYGVDYINVSFIDEEDTDGTGLKKGWNFTRYCEEPSLYFSYTVAECYLDFFSTFEDVLQYAYAKRNNRLYGIAVDDDVKTAYEAKAEEFIAKKDKEVASEKIARHDTYNEMVRLYRLINDLEELEELRIDDTRFGLLEKNCQNVAQAVWGYVRKSLGDKFFYNDLATTLVEDDLRMSTTSDALFNTVYIVNIMIDGGLDEIFQMKQRSAAESKNDAEAAMHQREYDNLLESCQLAVQRAFRTYESLKNDSKEYIVDQFLIGFNERFEYHKALVGELRKLRMKVFSLLPMLIHTNNIVSEYLVQYPQANMRKYLENILDNRYVKDGEVRWIWENDGYFSGSNYYYIYALNEFYAYYKKYEERYIAYNKKNEETEAAIIAGYREKLNAPEGEITLLKQEKQRADEEIAQRDAEISRLKQALLEVPTPVEDAVREIINEEMDQQFAERMARVFTHAAKALTLTEVDATEDPDGTYAKVCAAVLEMLTADIFAGYYSGQRKVKSTEDYEQRTKAFKGDVRETVYGYLSSINNSIDGKTSKLRKFFDKD